MHGMDKEPMAHNRLVVCAPASVIRRVDAYWHKCKLASRSEAIRRLIERGLEADGKKGKSK